MMLIYCGLVYWKKFDNFIHTSRKWLIIRESSKKIVKKLTKNNYRKKCLETFDLQGNLGFLVWWMEF